MEKPRYHLSDESDKHASTTATNLCIILQFIFTKNGYLYSLQPYGIT